MSLQYGNGMLEAIKTLLMFAVRKEGGCSEHINVPVAGWQSMVEQPCNCPRLSACYRSKDN